MVVDVWLQSSWDAWGIRDGVQSTVCDVAVGVVHGGLCVEVDVVHNVAVDVVDIVHNVISTERRITAFENPNIGPPP